MSQGILAMTTATIAVHTSVVPAPMLTDAATGQSVNMSVMTGRGNLLGEYLSYSVAAYHA